MASVTYEHPTLSAHEPLVKSLLERRPEIKLVVVGLNFKGLQKTGVPHGSQISLLSSATVAKSLLPEDQGSCVALFKINNFDELEHLKKLQDPQLNDGFLAKTGQGPTFDSAHCDAFACDLGRDKENWKPHLGDGMIGVVSLNGRDEWSKKHYVAVALPSLPLASDACIAISGRSFDDFAKHHYITTVLPVLIQRNVRKLAAAYAESFSLDLPHDADPLGSTALPKFKACCYDPVVHSKDDQTYLGSKILKSCNRTNILLVSPHVGLETNRTTSPIEVPFGLSHIDGKPQALGDKAEAYYGKIAYWPGKGIELHKKLKTRQYKVDSAQTFYEINPRANNRRTYRWISMTMGQK